MKNKLPPSIDCWIASLLIEANVNLTLAEIIYEKISHDTKTDKEEFLRFMANNSIHHALLTLGSILSEEKKDKKQNEFSIKTLGKDEKNVEFQEFYKKGWLKNVRDKSIAHKDRNHPNPAWWLENFIDEKHIKNIRELLDNLTNHFWKKYNWDLNYSYAWDCILRWLSEILKSI